MRSSSDFICVETWRGLLFDNFCQLPDISGFCLVMGACSNYEVPSALFEATESEFKDTMLT
jgi:hypothetical protein